MNEKAMGGVHNARSIHGCWTCRLRRKKCDETRPSCVTCSSLQIQCDGYGERPEWMDRGSLEKARASQLKLKISQNKQRRRKQSISRASAGEFGQAANINIDPFFQLADNDSRDISTYLRSLESPTYDWGVITPLQGHSFLQRLTCSPESQFTMPAVEGNSLDCPPLLHQLNKTSTPALHNSAMDTTFSGFQIITPPRSLSPSYLSDAPWDDTVLVPFITEGTESSGSNASSSRKGSVADNAEILPDSPGREAFLTSRAPRVEEGEAQINDNDLADRLLIHYLDEVFPIQFPLYHSLGRQCRGWLFSKLQRVKSAYHACLALSQYHQNTTDLPSSADVLGFTASQEKLHHNMALEGMQEMLQGSHGWSESTTLSRSLETLTCILLLMFCEIYPGGTKKWQLHLHGASACLPALLRAPEDDMNTAKTYEVSEYQPLKSSQRATSSLRMTKDSPMISFYLGHFVVFDILACASTRSTPFLNIDHKRILLQENYGVDLRNIIGCENWAMDILFDIATLDTWKKNAQKAKRLSIVELANQGAQIDARLRSKLAEIDKQPSSASSTRPLAATVHDETTKIYALSAMTYLHVVLSGAYPELPEIMESVGKTISAFQSLTNTKHFARLSWCLCITGCLAVETHQDRFREIFAATELDDWSSGTCIQALEIMEECWQIRKNSSSCDWVSVMDKRGEYILLF